MEEEYSYTTKRILNLTLEIIYLLTGENYGPLKRICDTTASRSSKGWNRNTSLLSTPLSPSSALERNNDKKILEVTQKIIELLTGEVPIRCQDVTVYFSMEEWEYLERHKDLYKDVMMEKRPPLTSADGSRNTPERCPRPLDSTQEHQKIPQEHQEISQEGQDERLLHVKVEFTKMEKYSKTEVSCEEEEDKEDLPTDGLSNENTPERCICPFYSQGSTQERHEIPQGDPDPAPEEHSNSEDYLDDDMVVVKVEDINDDEAYGRFDSMQKEEVVADYITTDGRYSGVKSPINSQNCETECENTMGSPGLHCGVLSSGPPTHRSSLYKTLPYISLIQAADPFSQQRIPAGEDSWSEGEEGLSSKSHQEQSLEAEVNPEVKPYSCSVCGKSFRVKSVLIRHEKVHTGEKPFECCQCGKSFAQKSDLAEHKRIHTGEKPYPCPECGKCFAKKTNLARHLRMHSGVKPYSCSVCGKAFTQKAALDEHVRIHTGEKPYACSHCSKCFAQKSAFAEHQRVHTGERPYACAECGKCFTQGSALAKHQRVHRNQKPRPCPQCGKLFPSEFLLALHERVHQASYQ